MAVNVKMGVDLGSFTSGIKEGQQILKGLNAEMKASEAEFKATGNAEQKLTSQTKTLNSQIQVQKGIADQARQALDRMTKAGVDPADAAYQKLYVTMMNAEAGANEAQAALNQLGTGAAQAATGADKMASSLNGISKKMSLDQVISGINTITTGLENAAKKAFELGEQIWNSMMDKARWADDTATMAQMYGIDVDTFQRMQKLVTNGLDTTVEAMLKSQQKLNKGVGDGTDKVMETLEQLGLAIRSGKDDMAHLITDDQTEMFWKAGQAILAMSDATEQESAAQALFGRSWHELVPLFTQYKTVEEYNKALEDTYVVSEEGVDALTELNDKYNELKGNFDTLSTEIMAQLAPALTEAADALNGMLTSLLEYLKTDEGKQMLQDLGTAVSGLFDDLGKIDPQTVVEGFTGVMNTLIDGIEWLVENKDSVVTALEGIVIGWGALKLTGGALDILKLINGLKGLTGGGAGLTSGAAAAGTAAGTSWATAFSSAAVTAAPWIASVFGIGAVAVAPALVAGAADQQRWNQQYANRMAAAGAGGANAWFIEQAANALGTDGQTNFGAVDSLLMGLASRQNQQKAELQNILVGSTTAGNDTWNLLNSFWHGAELDPNVVNELLQNVTDAMAAAGTKPKVEIDPEVPEDAAAMISSQIGTVTVRTTLAVAESEDGSHANGLWSVPYDGYLARLHKGERVMPAREVASRNYSSNLYVESMIMNGGTDAAGLASAMAAAQRRTMSGYGS